MRAYVLYYVPKGCPAEDVEILGLYESREGVDYAYDKELKERECYSHELRIDCFTVED